MKEVKNNKEVKDASSTRRDREIGKTGKNSMQGKLESSDRKPVNYEYANQVYSLRDQNPKLHKKYPEGVKFDSRGYPDFSPYATKSVKIDMKGNHTTDYTQANKAAGLERQPRGTVWHHHQDGKTMQLLPADLHSEVRHSGGVSALKGKRG